MQSKAPWGLLRELARFSQICSSAVVLSASIATHLYARSERKVFQMYHLSNDEKERVRAQLLTSASKLNARSSLAARSGYWDAQGLIPVTHEMFWRLRPSDFSYVGTGIPSKSKMFITWFNDDIISVLLQNLKRHLKQQHQLNVYMAASNFVTLAMRGYNSVKKHFKRWRPSYRAENSDRHRFTMTTMASSLSLFSAR